MAFHSHGMQNSNDYIDIESPVQRYVFNVEAFDSQIFPSIPLLLYSIYFISLYP